MDKSAIRNFAIEARKILMKSAITEAGFYGITKEGCESPIQKGQDFEVYKTLAGTENRIFDSDIKRRANLVNAIEEQGFEQVIEETAYTWFNRIIAIRFMEVNDYLPTRVRVLSSETGSNTPDIVTQSLDVDLNMTSEELEKVQLAKDNNKYDEAFRLLFIKQCNELNDILPGLFEKTDDYKELLLKLSYTGDGVVRMLVDTVPEDSFNVETEGQVEIIGWMYQYYNTELNDLVYDGNMSKSRIPKEYLPAATQLFTPDWAIRYMVDNSLGKIWIHNKCLFDDTLDEMEYAKKLKLDFYVKETEQEESIYLLEKQEENNKMTLEQLTCIDPCMGSGHILVYFFEVLMRIYEDEGYNVRDAAQSILENNLFGIDIDHRAWQLSYFAVMMMGRSYDRRIFKNVQFNRIGIIEVLETNKYAKYINSNIQSIALFTDEEIQIIKYVLDVLKDAKEFGTILKVDSLNYQMIKQKIQYLLDHIYDYSLIQQTFISSVGNELCKLLQVCIILNRRYSVVVTNPPYLGSGRYSSKLSEYVSLYYANEKADLSMVVYKKILSEMTELMGYCGLITTNSWMTLKSFAKIRKYMINNASIESIVEYGTELFDGKIGHNPIVSWINRNIALKKKFTGIDLTEYCYSRRDEKKKEFFNESNRHYISPEVLLIIPGMPINFSCDNAILKLFNNKKIGDNYELSNCIQPGDSEKYVRMWQEIDAKKINKKWYLLSKGGAYRKWYGNLEYIINYENNGEELLKCEKATLRGQENYFQSGFVWTRVTSSNTSFRFIENDKLVTDAGPIIYSNKLELLGFLNSKIGSKLLKVLNPTLNCQVGNVSSMPDIEIEDIGKLVSENIEIARKDWNSRETSFEFKTHPFIDIFKVNSEYSLKQIYHKWNLECKERFNRLKNNENRITKIICERYNVNYTDVFWSSKIVTLVYKFYATLAA